MDDEQRRAMERAMDPLYDQRAEMPQAEFDAVDYFVHEAGRSPAPAPNLAVYLASGLTQPELAGRIGGLLERVAATAPGVRPATAGWALEREAPAGTGTWAGDTLGRIEAALRTGRVEMMQIGLADGERWLTLAVDAVPGDPAAGLALSAAGHEDDPWPPGTADALLALIAAEPDLRTAAITWDRSGIGRTPWELWYGANVGDVLAATRDHVRGYYWANLLGRSHLARLGGEQALRDRAGAAGFMLEPAVSGVVLRDPGPITEFGDDRLAAMKELLRPVLIDRPYLCYQGYPLRIIPDPGTAFRRVPPGSPFPRLTA